MKTFYLQLAEGNVITDIVEEKQIGYTEVKLPLPLPIGLNGGWWKWDNELGLVEVPELNPNNIENRIQVAIDEYTESLVEMGLL